MPQIPQPPPLELSKKDEYFIAIAQQGVHSFMMLGVMHNGSPQLLARVGKTGDIDPLYGKSGITKKTALGDGSLARLADEGITRSEGSVKPITYQAYSINFKQVKEFIGMIADIENRQLSNNVIRERIEQAPIKRKAIGSYVPAQEDENKVTFEWKALQDCVFQTENEHEQRVKNISDGAQLIKVSNNCRTTSLNIVEAILGFTTNISKCFFVSPKYKTTLDAGQPNKDTFYILPPPPSSVSNEPLTDRQRYILNRLYKRLEEIPKLNPDSKKTRNKFDAIKSIYKDISGIDRNQLSAEDLMRKIMQHEDELSDNLFEKREPNFFSKLFSISSTTEKMFKDIKSNLKKEKEEHNEIDEENSSLFTNPLPWKE